MQTLVIGWVWLFVGCDPGYPDIPLLANDAPSCASIETFGNGEPCDPSADGTFGLAERCGEGGACASSGVCVGRADILACRCTEDIHCTGWWDYLVASGVASEKDAEGVLCYGGGCIHAPARWDSISEQDARVLGDID